MKKSKIINLMLLTASFTAGAKSIANFHFAAMPPAITPECAIADNGKFVKVKNTHLTAFNLGNNTNDLAHDLSIVRGGFGDKEHSGAEQCRNEKKDTISAP